MCFTMNIGYERRKLNAFDTRTAKEVHNLATVNRKAVMISLTGNNLPFCFKKLGGFDMSEIRISSFVVGTRFPLTAIISEILFLLMKITEIREFKDGKYNDNVLGYTYECVDLIDFRRLKIKIEGQKKPLMTNEALQELRQSGSKIFVEFENPTIMPFVNAKTNSLDDSIKADDVKLVENEFTL